MAEQNTIPIRINKELHDDIFLIKLKCKAKNVSVVLAKAIKLLKKYLKENGYDLK